jgi:outer membrane lipoprotein SlyB
METKATQSPHTLFWIAGIAVTVFSVAGIAAIMGWIPTSSSGPTESIAVPPQTMAPAKPASGTNTASAQARRDEAREQAREAARRDEAREARARAQAQVAQARCAECGVIESVREIATKGTGSGIGAVGGAVVGGVLGHQVGGGRGQDIATVVGAVGGAVAGNEIEKRVKAEKSFDITVRFEDGSSRVINQASAPSWRIGDRVKVINGVIQSNA